MTSSNRGGETRGNRLPIYVINLDRAVARLEIFTTHARERGLAFERVSGVDGRLVDEAISRAVIAVWRPRIWTPPNPGEIGCFLSHREVWRRIVERGEAWAFVAEDDIRFSPEAARVLHEGSFPDGVDVIKAETRLEPVTIDRAGIPLFPGYDLHRIWSRHLGSGGYLVSAAGARRLLAWSERHSGQVDTQLFDPEVGTVRGLAVRQLVPAICVQKQYLANFVDDPSIETQIGDDPRSSFDHDRRFVVTRKMRRELNRARVRFVPWLLGLFGAVERRIVPFADGSDQV